VTESQEKSSADSADGGRFRVSDRVPAKAAIIDNGSITDLSEARASLTTTELREKRKKLLERSKYREQQRERERERERERVRERESRLLREDRRFAKM